MTNVGFRLGAAGQIIELRQAENDPKETFPDCLKRDFDPRIPNHGIAGLAVEFIALRASKVTVGLVASAG